MVVEENWDTVFCPCRRNRYTKKVAYSTEGSKVLHKKKNSYHLRKTKTHIHAVNYREDCGGEETATEDER